MERRKSARIPADYEVFMDDKGHVMDGKTRDISVTGIGLYTSEPIPPGARIGLSIIVPDWNITFRAVGQVRYNSAAPSGSPGPHLVGIEFIEGHEDGLPFLETQNEYGKYEIVQTVTVDRSLDACYRAVTAVERYPEWTSGLERAVVKDRHPDGRARSVEYVNNFLVRKVRHTDVFSYDDSAYSLSWQSGDADKDLVSNTGGYDLRAVGANKTLVTFHINIVVSFIPSRRLVNYFSTIFVRKEMRNLKKFIEEKF